MCFFSNLLCFSTFSDLAADNVRELVDDEDVIMDPDSLGSSSVAELEVVLENLGPNCFGFPAIYVECLLFLSLILLKNDALYNFYSDFLLYFE